MSHGGALRVLVAWGMRVLGRVLCELEVSSLFLCRQVALWKFSLPASRRDWPRRAGKFPGRDKRWLTPDECVGN